MLDLTEILKIARPEDEVAGEYPYNYLPKFYSVIPLYAFVVNIGNNDLFVLGFERGENLFYTITGFTIPSDAVKMKRPVGIVADVPNEDFFNNFGANLEDIKGL